MTKSKIEKKPALGGLEGRKKNKKGSSTDEEEATSSTPAPTKPTKKGTLTSSEGSSSSSDSSSGSSSSSSSSSSDSDSDQAPAQTPEKKDKGKSKKKVTPASSTSTTPSPTKSPVKKGQVNNTPKAQGKKKVPAKAADGSKGKKEKGPQQGSVTNKAPVKGAASSSATPATPSKGAVAQKKKQMNGTMYTPPGKKMPIPVKTSGETKKKSPAKASVSIGKTVPKVTGGKVPPKKVESPKKEKKLAVSSSSAIVGVVTRRSSRSTSCSSSVSSTTSTTDSSSDSSNESSKSNDGKPKPPKTRLSSTSTSTSTSGSSSSSSSSDDDDGEAASVKTPVVRAPPSLAAKTKAVKTIAQNRVSKRDEAAVKKGAKSRKKPPSILGSEVKLMKTRSSSSCSSSAERSSAASTTSSSSARSRSSMKRKRIGGKTKPELSIASNMEEDNMPDIIQKHWQQIPRVKAKPPASTTFIIPATDDNKESAKEDNETETEQASRPVTRRQISKVKKSNKTIPTTTKFSLDKLHEKLECSSNSPRVVYNEASDSDYSCGSGGDNQVFIRCVPAKSSTGVNKRVIVEDDRVCMFPGCDSNGHLSGLYDRHCLINCCPKYHIDSAFFLGRGEEESRTEDADPGSGDELAPRNPAEECQQLSRMRSNRMTARSHYTPASSNPLTLIPTSNHQKLFKNPNRHHQPQEVKIWISKMKEWKDTKLDSNTSEYDMSLWRDALALAAAQIESEQNASVNFNKWSLAMGKFEMGCWCCNPYPEPLAQLRRIFICEFCLKPVQSGTVLRRHCAKCVWRHPPGDEIYRKDRLSVWEVDGKTQKSYCQFLCLLAKCFLDHKTLYLDVDPFLFYVMTLSDSQGCHLVGYFSKEKNSFLNYNVSCILTLPPYQRQGFGRLLIDFSYLLTRVEGKIGSPEKPLSDLGLISYRSYWKDAVLRRMCACASRDVGIKELSQELGISSADLVSTLQFLGMLKYWKGKHLVLKKQDVLEEYLDKMRRRGVEQRQIDSSCLRWRPYQPPPDSSSQPPEEPNSISSILNSVVSGGGGATTD